jgi:hypothetical protein
MAKTNKMTVLSHPVTVKRVQEQDYISLTDIARVKETHETDDVIRNWLRNRNTIEFLGIWEQLNNPGFNPVEFDGFRRQAGLNSFTLTAKQWIEKTGAIGITSKPGRYGGTFAHVDIALAFAAWVSIEFKLYLIKEFQRLKEEERRTLDWDVRRNLAKINYRIHTDAIKANLIPEAVTREQASQTYASEADVLNVALFGQTARQWRDANSGAKGNIRDQANGAQLVCLSNLESLNAELIKQGVAQPDRLRRLNAVAIEQMKLLADQADIKPLRGQ